ncbi:hypothetical protein [Burkholderia singularis]|uniref:hypothetical protein n=1 Tax=Burkholderia singularis TaxID=1503053 RepID=UPI000AEEB75A|nr:hypothetical protein [Burkholderia singularis]
MKRSALFNIAAERPKQSHFRSAVDTYAISTTIFVIRIKKHVALPSSRERIKYIIPRIIASIFNQQYQEYFIDRPINRQPPIQVIPATEGNHR